MAAVAMTLARSDASARARRGQPRHVLRRWNPQDIADTANGVNQAWLTLVDLAAQVAYARFHYVPVAGGVVVPDMIKYLLFGQDAAGVEHQEPQQPELGGRQRDGGAVAPDFMAVFVEFQVGDA